jgi:hypothetical protein
MVRATDRHTSGVYRHGCRDGAAAPQFLSLNNKTIVKASVRFDSSQKAGAHPFQARDRLWPIAIFKPPLVDKKIKLGNYRPACPLDGSNMQQDQMSLDGHFLFYGPNMRRPRFIAQARIPWRRRRVTSKRARRTASRRHFRSLPQALAVGRLRQEFGTNWTEASG